MMMYQPGIPGYKHRHCNSRKPHMILASMLNAGDFLDFGISMVIMA